MPSAAKSKIPAAVRGLKWRIDDRYSLTFDDNSDLAWSDKQSYHCAGRMPLKRAKASALAVLAAVAAYEEAAGEAIDVPPVEVSNYIVQYAIQGAEEAARRCDEAAANLREVLAKARGART